ARSPHHRRSRSRARQGRARHRSVDARAPAGDREARGARARRAPWRCPSNSTSCLALCRRHGSAAVLMKRGIVLIAILNACQNVPAAFAPPPTVGGSARVERARAGLHALARGGDLEIFDARDMGLIISVSVSAPGHRPLAGAVVDLLARQNDDAAADPLEWWRIGWIDGNGVFHPPSSAKVAVDDGGCAVISSTAEMVSLRTSFCPQKVGFLVRTSASGLPN